jgi:hypothetical protein
MTTMQIQKQTLAVPEMLAPILPEMQAVEAFLEAQAETAIPQFSELTRPSAVGGGANGCAPRW